MMARGEILELIDTWQKALNAHDVDALVELFTPDAEFVTSFRIVDEGHAFAGHEGIRRFFTAMFPRYPRLQSRVTNVVVDVDSQQVAVEYLWGSPDEQGQADWVVTALVAGLRDGRFSSFRFYRRV